MRAELLQTPTGGGPSGDAVVRAPDAAEELGPRPSVIFLNRYFFPDHSATSQMLSDLAFALAARGIRVRVITSRQLYDAAGERLPPRETIEGVEVHRVWTTRFGRQSLRLRAVDYLTFYASAAAALARMARKGDAVVVKTDPPMLSVPASLAARLRGAKLVNWLQDLFPEVAQALGMGNRGIARLVTAGLTGMRNRSLQHAAMNVAIGERMAERLRSLGIAPERIVIVQNWADGRLVTPRERSGNALRRSWGLDGRFVVGYSGNLGRAHEIETLLDAIARVEAESRDRPGSVPQVTWLFIGGGALHAALRDAVERRGLGSVQFRPYQPRERLAESLSAADVHLVSLRTELEGLIVPSKFYGIAAAGRPAIFIGDENGEVARIISRWDCGRTVSEGDGAALARTVLELATDAQHCERMGRNARTALDTELDRSLAVARWEQVLLALSAAAVPGVTRR